MKDFKWGLLIQHGSQFRLDSTSHSLHTIASKALQAEADAGNRLRMRVVKIEDVGRDIWEKYGEKPV